MQSESFYEPINLLVLAENYSLQYNFINNLQDFLENAKYYKPSNYRKTPNLTGKTTSYAFYRKFNIIYGLGLSESYSSYEIFSNFFKIQDLFIQPINLNAIIFLMRPDPRYYEHFLSLNLLNNFSKDDTEKIERNVIFIFMHESMESYQKRDAVNVEFWTILDRIGADLFDSLTLHCQSLLDRDFCNQFLQILYKYKKTLPVETVYSHESVLKTVENEDFLDLLLDALYVNEINIENEATVEKKQYYLVQSSYYCIICTNKKCLKTCKNYCSPKESLENESTCSICNCSVKDHKLSKHSIEEQKYSSEYTKNNKEYRQTLISAIVAIDLFHKENNAKVGQLHHRIMERIKQETSYSVLETRYKNEKDGRKKRITADDCMKSVRSSLFSLAGLVTINDFHLRHSFSVRGNLRAKN